VRKEKKDRTGVEGHGCVNTSLNIRGGGIDLPLTWGLEPPPPCANMFSIIFSKKVSTLDMLLQTQAVRVRNGIII